MQDIRAKTSSSELLKAGTQHGKIANVAALMVIKLDIVTGVPNEVVATNLRDRRPKTSCHTKLDLQSRHWQVGIVERNESKAALAR